MSLKKEKIREKILYEFIKYDLFTPSEIYFDDGKSLSHKNNMISDGVIFFQVVKGSLYFMLMGESLLCIHSPDKMLGRDDIDRDIRISSIESISFERFLEVIPKELSSKFLYHIDIFQEFLEVNDKLI